VSVSAAAALTRLRAGAEPAPDPERQQIASSARSRLLYRHDGRTSYRLEVERHVAYDVVETSRSVFDAADPTLAEALDGRPVFVVIDRRVDAIYGVALRAYAATALRSLGIYALHAVETTKSLATVEALCAAAHAAGLPRDGVLLGIGGGVTLDQAGLAAALYRRGVRYARVPTTLVGIVDVGVGIKQAVNAEGRKSLLGAFYPAYVNVTDATFLASLPEPAIACGFAEIVKMALISDPRLFDLLERDGAELVASRFQHGSAREVIARAQVTMMDELRDNLYEDDHARSVDFGHTFSPSLEARTGYRVAHGEAVAVDIVLSTAIAVELGLCEATLLPRVASLLRGAGLPVAHETLDRELAFDAIDAARAHRDGALNLVVPLEIGAVTFVQDLDGALLDAALARTAAV
jgi:2-epi-5-epi-valiolone synthase